MLWEKSLNESVDTFGQGLRSFHPDFLYRLLPDRFDHTATTEHCEDPAYGNRKEPWCQLKGRSIGDVVPEIPPDLPVVMDEVDPKGQGGDIVYAPVVLHFQ